jgi:hypothetical protein
MNHKIFFISTLVLISLIYHLLLKYFSDSNKTKGGKWFNFIYINAGAILINYYAFKGLSEIEKTDYSIAYPIGVTFIMYIMRRFYEYQLTPSNSFLSAEQKTSNITLSPARDYKKVLESDAEKISIYPRITIIDCQLESEWQNPKHIIFDSSDFVIINKTFGAFDNLQESFSQGKKIKFKDEYLLTEKVQVDFMNIYDDYTGGLISKHTDAYEGRDTPYHIQIIVWARRIR